MFARCFTPLIILALGVVFSFGNDTAAPPLDLCVATFNLRVPGDTGPHAWPKRRPAVQALWQKLSPDIVGTQEGVYAQLKNIATDLPDYAWIGTGRDGGSRGEFMAIFYKKARLEPLAYDHFWLSDTPDKIASVTWGHHCRRMITWVRFRDKATGREFYFWNTHFDHESAPAREKSAALVLERVRALKTTLPVLLVGDFNATAGPSSKPYTTLVNDTAFADTWTLAAEKENAGYNTFHGYRTPRQNDRRIDWILARGAVQVKKSSILIDQPGDIFPSDHFPVVAWIKI